MDVKLIGFCLLLAIGTSCSNPVEKATDTSINQSPPDGELLFLNNCASCHGVDGKLGVSDAKDLTKTKLESSEIYTILVKGKNEMPPFGYIITTEEERNAVVDHIISLKE